MWIFKHNFHVNIFCPTSHFVFNPYIKVNADLSAVSLDKTSLCLLPASNRSCLLLKKATKNAINTTFSLDPIENAVCFKAFRSFSKQPFTLGCVIQNLNVPKVINAYSSILKVAVFRPSEIKFPLLSESRKNLSKKQIKNSVIKICRQILKKVWSNICQKNCHKIRQKNLSQNPSKNLSKNI